MEKIGNFFVKIGQGMKKGFIGLINWVKNTAWIQPLLIVGLIFGVILSIKPVTSWITGLLNPDTTYQFFKENNAEFSKDLDEKLKELSLQPIEKDSKETDSKETKTVIAIYYSDDDSDCANIETTLRTLEGDLKKELGDNIVWCCINTNFDTTTEDGQNKKYEYDNTEFFENYKDIYSNLYNNNTYIDLVGEHDSDNNYTESFWDVDHPQEITLPLPLFVRYNDGEICGVKPKYNTDISGNKAYHDIKRFVSGDPTTDWKLNLTNYISKQG